MIPKIEIATTAEIKSFQEQKLVELLRYVNANSPFYSSLFAKKNIDISNIKTIEDLTRCPLPQKKICKNTMMIFYVFLQIKLLIMPLHPGLWEIRLLLD